MELPFPFSFTTCILLLCSSLLIFYNLHFKRFHKGIPNLPPSPWKLPLIGHLHHLAGRLPHRCFQEFSTKYGPIMHFKLGGVTTIVVSSPDLAKEVLKVQDPTFTDKPEMIAAEILWYNSSLSFSQYGDYWRQMRKICMIELLSVKNVRSFGLIRNDEVSRLAHSIVGDSGNRGTLVDLTEEVAKMTSSIICRAAFGRVCRDKEKMIEMLKDGIALLSGLDVCDLYPSSKMLKAMSWNRVRLLKMRRKLDPILDGIIAEHRRNRAEKLDSSGNIGNGEFGNEDLIDVLIRHMESGELEFPITDDNIKAMIYDIFAAGTETASTTINWIMAELMRHPNVMAKAQSEIRQTLKENTTFGETEVQKLKYLKLVIKEGLRLHPPVPLIPRVCRNDTEIKGYFIPARSRVPVNSWAIGRDPRIWPDPESFIPERFEDMNHSSIDFNGNHAEYIPFGAGRRMCPGMNFGLASVELPLAHLLYHFEWKLPHGMSPQDLDMVERLALAAARRTNLKLIAVPYDFSMDK
uniref:CYP71D175 n=1 Tax=Scoparia dulcis TaxID=107240 RepID=D4P921_SCODU|nr:CYP71D175 [Scoparia dulcis]